MSAPDRTRPPEPGAMRPFSFPDVERRRLDGGIELRVARMDRLPVVAANLFMRAGEGVLGEERAGLAVLAGDALEGGTRRRGGSELAEALEGIGARLEVRTGWEGTSVALSCLAERLGEGLALLAEAVTEPDFPKGEVERAREQRLARIRQRAMDPASIASDHLARMTFAEGVPYARPQGGTDASVAALGREALLGFADACWRPRGGGIVVAGDVEADEVEDHVREAFAGWTGAPALQADFEVAPDSVARRLRVIDRPGSVQSELRVGHVGVARSDPAHIDLMVLNSVLGGSFTSRLNLNLRERHGFTYGVRSRFAMRTRPGPFHVSTAVGTDVTADALREVLHELETLVDEGPRDEEVSAARDYLAGVFPLRLQAAGQVAARLTESLIHDLADDYHATYRDRIRAVSTEAAGAAARAHVRPAEMQILVVGDAETVAPALEALGIGDVEVRATPA